MNEYFATKEISKIGSDLEKVTDYYDHLDRSGRLDLWNRSHHMYYSAISHGGRIQTVGKQQEFSKMHVNHYRNIGNHLVNLVTRQRPTFEARAVNTDYKSVTQCTLANGLLEYYMREKRLDRDLDRASKFSILYGEGYPLLEWDVNNGDVYAQEPATDPETGEPAMDEGGQPQMMDIQNGDIANTSMSPIDIIRDSQKNNYKDLDWVIIRRFKNKFDLATKYSEYAEQIVAMSYTYSLTNHDYIGTREYGHMESETDDIPHYTFYHKKTDTMPNGRMIEFLSDDALLTDNPLPYRDVPLRRITADDEFGTPFGYTVMFDLMPLQQSIDALYSTVTTNQKAFGVQLIASPKASGIKLSQLANGLAILEYNEGAGGGKPEPLNLLQTAPETYNYIEQLEHVMETISGVNSVQRGNPEASLKSGAALALVQSMAIQYSQDLQRSYVELVEDDGTDLVHILKEYANVPRVAAIVGKSKRAMMSEFTGEDLSLISRVTVDMGTPLSRTTAGKVNLAQMLIEAGLLKTPEQLVQVIQTGQVESLVEGDMAELGLIKSENESMQEGKQVSVLLTDSHMLHIKEHKVPLSSPEARKQKHLVNNVLAHIQEHLNVLMDPAQTQMLTLLGQQPMAPMGPEGMPMPPPEGRVPPEGADAMGAIGEAANPAAPITQAKNKVSPPNLPTMPKNALTKNQWNPVDGGGGSAATQQ